MLEWHALATRGNANTTWHDGRYLSEWADPAAVDALPATFAAYDRADLARTLPATVELYLRLEKETAGAWGYAPAGRESEAVTTWIRQTLVVNPRY
jgi:aminoglycoside 6-adenylyltransferase